MVIDDIYVKVQTVENKPQATLRGYGDVLILGCTKESENISKVIDIYSSLEAVLLDFDADSEEAIAAKMMFSQFPRMQNVLISTIVPEEGVINAYRKVLAVTKDFDNIYLAGHRESGPSSSPFHNYGTLRSAFDFDEIVGKRGIFFTWRDEALSIINGEAGNLSVYVQGPEHAQLGTFYQYPTNYTPEGMEGEESITLGKDEQPGAALIAKFIGDPQFGKRTVTNTQVDGVTPINDLTKEQAQYLLDQNINYYTTKGGRECFVVGRMMDGSPMHLHFEKGAATRLITNTISTELAKAGKMVYDAEGSGIAAIESMIRSGFDAAKKARFIQDYTLTMPLPSEVTNEHIKTASLPTIFAKATLSNSIEFVNLAIAYAQAGTDITQI